MTRAGNLEIEDELDLLRDAVALLAGLAHRDHRRPSLRATLGQRLREVPLRIGLATEETHRRARQDSNLWPPPPEGGALSS
jgi:hypothetical protein